MYEIFLFSGGVYRFNEFKEAVEDVGGIVLKKDLFHLSRGSSILGDEVEVIIIIPLDDEELIKNLSEDIKGHLEKVESEDLEKNDMLTYISISDALTKSGKWMTKEDIKNSIECPCPAQLCQDQEIDICILDHIDDAIMKFCQKDILISRENKDKKEYFISKN